MSSITLDLKTMTTWITVAGLVVGGVVALASFGMPASISRVVKAEEQISQNKRRTVRNATAITRYGADIANLKIDRAVNTEYQRGVQRDLTDAKQERKDLDADIQKIIRLLGSSTR